MLELARLQGQNANDAEQVERGVWLLAGTSGLTITLPDIYIDDSGASLQPYGPPPPEPDRVTPVRERADAALDELDLQPDPQR